MSFLKPTGKHKRMDPEIDRKKGSDKFFTTPLMIILITVFIDLIGFGMVIPILPFYAEALNASPFQIGLLFSIYSWMQFFFAPILGRLSDNYGRRPILFASLLGSAVGYFVIGWAETLALVFVGRIISGITGGNISTAQAYIADVTSKEDRARGMGLFGAAFGLGFILGPAIAGILSKYGIHVPFYFAAVLSLANAAALYFILPESVRKRDPSADPPKRRNRFAEFAEVLRQRRFGLINLVYFLLVIAFSIMTYAFVLYTAYRFGYNAEQNGYLFAYVGVVAIVAQGLIFSKLVKRFGEAPLIAFGSLLMAAGLFTMPMIGPQAGGLAGLLIGLGVLSFGNSLASPGLTSIASKVAGESEQGKLLGIMQSCASLARAVGPTFGGYLLSNALGAIDEKSLYRTFWVATGIMFIAFLVAIYSMRTFREPIAA